MRIERFLCCTLFALAILTGCTLQPGEQDSVTVNLEGINQKESVPVAEANAMMMVDMINNEGKKIGIVSLKEETAGVHVQIEISKLKPGKHGFHVHERTFKDTDFISAGGHFNPTNKEHGLKNPKGHHLGDMHNLSVKKDGAAIQTEFIQGATLKEGHQYSLLGKSIIIHADEDDQVSNPAGNSGERVAGGNIIK